MNEPNIDILSEFFHSQEWQALKTEIEICRDNSYMRVKREGEMDRNGQAGMLRAYDVILGFEVKYKNAKKVSSGTEN